jgi:hypothetical protein
MNRLQSEHQRLYVPLLAADGRVHGMVLAVAQPAGWDELGAVWRGVQLDLELPAPAIAVDGDEAYQLWFSLREPVAPQQAIAFLQGLCARYLAGTRPERIRRFPDDVTAEPLAPPPRQVAADRWSAFVASDLAPLFADDRCLDQPPGEEAQADLLSRIEGMKPEFFARACAQLATASLPATPPASPPPPAAAVAPADDPRRFLLAVMQDPAVDLHLRIEAAKALLQARR